MAWPADLQSKGWVVWGGCWGQQQCWGGKRGLKSFLAAAIDWGFWVRNCPRVPRTLTLTPIPVVPGGGPGLCMCSYPASPLPLHPFSPSPSLPVFSPAELTRVVHVWACLNVSLLGVVDGGGSGVSPAQDEHEAVEGDRRRVLIIWEQSRWSDPWAWPPPPLLFPADTPGMEPSKASTKSAMAPVEIRSCPCPWGHPLTPSILASLVGLA